MQYQDLNTPCYILDLSKLTNNLNGLKQAFTVRWTNTQISYSFKTNNLPWLVNWMRKQGVYAEVVSAPEYDLAKYVGFSENNIVINGPYKGYSTLLEAVQKGSVVNLDNFEEIFFLIGHKDDLPTCASVGLRINFDLEFHCPGETIPGKEPGRFGFNVENGDIYRAIRLLEGNGISVVGFHGHHSTKTKSLKIFQTITSHMCEVAKSVKNLQYLDIGGCLFGDKPGAPSFDEYATIIVNEMKAYHIKEGVRLIVEPGAALVASPFSYLCEVNALKDIAGVRFVYTNGSMKHIAPQMTPVKFCYSRTGKGEMVIPRQVVTGYTCIEKDRFLDVENETEIRVGEKIEIKNTGAYTMSLAPLFIEYFPDVYVKETDSYRLVREHWGTQQFIQNNILD